MRYRGGRLYRKYLSFSDYFISPDVPPELFVDCGSLCKFGFSGSLPRAATSLGLKAPQEFHLPFRKTRSTFLRAIVTDTLVNHSDPSLRKSSSRISLQPNADAHDRHHSRQRPDIHQPEKVFPLMITAAADGSADKTNQKKQNNRLGGARRESGGLPSSHGGVSLAETRETMTGRVARRPRKC